MGLWCVCVSEVLGERGGRDAGGGVILAYLSVSFYWWRGGGLVCVQNKLLVKTGKCVCGHTSAFVLVNGPAWCLEALVDALHSICCQSHSYNLQLQDTAL